MRYKKISIIIPVYNSVNYLEQAIDSVKMQKYPNFEIILVDDGSSDGSERLCDILAEQDNRIRVIHSINEGPALARNKGLDQADGKYIYFMDSDDYLNPGVFSTIIPVLEEQGYEMVVFNYQKINQKGEILSNSHFKEGIYKFQNTEDKIRFILQNVFTYSIGWELWNRVYRRDIIEKNHIRFVDANYAEDLYFLLCYLGCIDNMICINHKFYNYLIHSNSLMDKSTKQKSDNLNKVNNLSYELNKFYISLGLERYYPIIHYNFLKQHINALYSQNWTLKQICKFLRRGMDKSNFCLQEFEQFIKNTKIYYNISDKDELLLDKRILQYYCDGKWFKFRIKAQLNRLIKFNKMEKYS